MQPLRVVFVVQGEGRGHMTQALALGSALRDAGHGITRVLVGRSPWRSVPEYFRAGVDAPLIEFEAPAQVPGVEGRAASTARTLLDVAARAPDFVRAVDTIGRHTADADVVVNFLDFMAGVTRARSPGAPTIAVAHNYVFLHPALESAPGPQHARRAVLAYAEATAAGATERVALSFDRLPDVPTRRLRVAPPLLRPGLDELPVADGAYLLAYALNAGYGEALRDWQARNPDVEVHCYLDGGVEALGGPAGSAGTGPGFHAHDLDGRPFLEHLAGCRAYVGSAGFESLCEAHWLGKPTLAVPTEGQFEQTLNAWDAQRCEVARAGTYDDLDDFWRAATAPDAEAVRRFRAWVARAPDVLVDAVERTAHIPRT
jgi:uncharacterized protein (TIGR00661 family)